MMPGLRQYFLSVMASSLSCALVSQIISDTKRKELMHLVCGIVMALVLVKPLTEINPERFLNIPMMSRTDADSYIAEGERAASDVRSGCIKASCEAYILDKAKALGTELKADVHLNEALIPAFAEISGDFDAKTQVKLQEVLTMDLGIPKENQKWIWNPERSS